MNYKPRFPAQHTTKCYCNSCCTCRVPEKLKEPSTNEFVKARFQTRRPLSRISEQISESRSTSRSQSKCSIHYLNDASTHSSTTMHTELSTNSSNLQLSDRRLRYEALKDDFHDPSSMKNSKKTTEEVIIIPKYRSRDELKGLSEFRLENLKDCLGSVSQHLASERLKAARAEHVCEFRYFINNRGLLEAMHKNKGGEALCTSCKKSIDSQQKLGNGMKSQQTKRQYKFVLEVQEKDLPRAKQKARTTSENVPDNCLALAILTLSRKKRNYNSAKFQIVM